MHPMRAILQVSRENGLRGVIDLLAENVAVGYRNTMRPYVERFVDLRWNIDSTADVDLDDLDFESPNKHLGVRYEPTPARTFFKLMSYLPRSLGGFDFIDFGCGKGRVLSFAARWDFERIVGIDFSPQLADIARSNMRKLQVRTGDSRFEVICVDAAAFPIPERPCVCYFYNPFSGVVVERVARNLHESLLRHPRKIYVVFLNIKEASHIFFELDSFRLVASGKYRWDAAARQIDPYAIFESRGDAV